MRDAFDGWLSVTVFEGVPPVPASRPRVGRWGTYYSPTYAKWKKTAEERAARLLSGEPFTSPVILLTEVVVEKPRTSKLDYPRPDIDNLAKGPLDAITKAAKLWVDDKQVVGLLAFKRFAEPGERAGTRIDFIQLEGAA